MYLNIQRATSCASQAPNKRAAARCNCAGPPLSFQLSGTDGRRRAETKGITRRVVAWHTWIAHAMLSIQRLPSHPSPPSELLLISFHLLLTAFLNRNEPSAFIGMKLAAERSNYPSFSATATPSLRFSPTFSRFVFASCCCLRSNTFCVC